MIIRLQKGAKVKHHHSHIEDRDQRNVVVFLKLQYPKALFTISPQNQVNTFQAKRNKWMGYRAGTPDLMIFEPRGPYHGFFIELKRSIGRAGASIEQEAFLSDLRARGYKAEVCKGFLAAQKAINDYMRQGEAV